MSPAAHGPAAEGQARGLVIGLGNRWRGDDGVGPAAVAALREALAEHPAPPAVDVATATGEPAELMELWSGHDRVWLIDALVAGEAPGTLHRLDGHEPLPHRSSHSSHGIGLAQAVELARALDALPPRLTIHGVEPASLEEGDRLSPAVAAALPTLVTSLLDEMAQ